MPLDTYNVISARRPSSVSHLLCAGHHCDQDTFKRLMSWGLSHRRIQFRVFSTGAKSKEKRKEEEKVPKLGDGESTSGAAAHTVVAL